MDKNEEYVKTDLSEVYLANLKAIVVQLEACKYNDAIVGTLVNNPAFIELKRIAQDSHEISVALAFTVDADNCTQHTSYITDKDLGHPLPDGMVMRVCTDYVLANLPARFGK